MAKANKLKFILDGIIKDKELLPQKDEQGQVVKTFCNIALERALNEMGYHGLDGKMANDICECLMNAPEWIEIGPSQAQKAANRGFACIAAHPYAGHGHVAMAAPGNLVYSGHWSQYMPIVANVGKDVGYMGANMAFPVTDTPPKFYLLLQEDAT